MEIAPGVHALELPYETPDGTVPIHPCAIETPKGLLLVDAGAEGTSDALQNQLAGLGYGIDDVHWLLLTHQDGDHAGAAEEIVEASGAPVLAHKADAPAIDGRRDPIKSPAGKRYPPIAVDLQLTGTELIRTDAGPMVVVHTPGHTPGHLSLHLPSQRLLIAGDALVAQGGLQGPVPAYTPDLDEAYASIATLAERETDEVLCFHGGLVEADRETIARIAKAGPP